MGPQGFHEVAVDTGVEGMAGVAVMVEGACWSQGGEFQHMGEGGRADTRVKGVGAS